VRRGHHEHACARGKALTVEVNELPAAAEPFVTDSVTDIQD
jgi:hypothetical protein